MGHASPDSVTLDSASRAGGRPPVLLRRNAWGSECELTMPTTRTSTEEVEGRGRGGGEGVREIGCEGVGGGGGMETRREQLAAEW